MEHGTGNSDQVTGKMEQGTGNREQGTGTRDHRRRTRDQGAYNNDHFTFCWNILRRFSTSFILPRRSMRSSVERDFSSWAAPAASRQGCELALDRREQISLQQADWSVSEKPNNLKQLNLYFFLRTRPHLGLVRAG